MEVAVIPKRIRRRSQKDIAVTGAADPDDDPDDDIAQLIARARRLRDRMLQATGNSSPGVPSPGPSSTIELDILNHVMGDDDAIDTEALFANLFFGTEGAEAMTAARQRQAAAAAAVADREMDPDDRDAENDHHSDQRGKRLCLHLVRLTFDGDFPFTTTSPSIQITFAWPGQPSNDITITAPYVSKASRAVIPIDQKLTLTPPPSSSSYIPFTARCDRLSIGSRPCSVTMTGFLSLNGWYEADPKTMSRDLDLISRDRRWRCTLRLRLSSSRSSPDPLPSSPDPDRLPSHASVQRSDPPTPIRSSSPPIVDTKSPSLTVRSGDLVVIQVGIRTGVVTVTDRQRYVFVAYQAFADQARAYTRPRPERYCARFDHIGQMARLYSDALQERMRSAILILELWTCASPRPPPNPSARLLGLAKVRLQRLLPCLGAFNKQVDGSADLVSITGLTAFDDVVEVRDVVSDRTVGRLSLALALGSLPQMTLLGDVWRAVVPIQRLARGFLCRRRCPNRDRVAAPSADPTRSDTASDERDGGERQPRDCTRSESPEPASSAIVPFEDRHDDDDAVALEIGCDRAANLTDPELGSGSLYVQFRLDPIPIRSHQSGRGSTHLVPGCSHPIWAHRLRLYDQVLPDPSELVHSEIVFALHLRPSDRCLGRARLRLLRHEQPDTVHWLDLINNQDDRHPCIGQLQVHLRIGAAIAKALRSPSLQADVGPRPATPPPLSLRLSPAPCMAAQDETFAPMAVSVRRPSRPAPAYLGPPLTMADVDRQLDELDQVKARLLEQFQTGRHRVPVIFTRHHQTVTSPPPDRSDLIEQGPAPSPSNATNIDPVPIPIHTRSSPIPVHVSLSWMMDAAPDSGVQAASDTVAIDWGVPEPDHGPVASPRAQPNDVDHTAAAVSAPSSDRPQSTMGPASRANDDDEDHRRAVSLRLTLTETSEPIGPYADEELLGDDLDPKARFDQDNDCGSDAPVLDVAHGSMVASDGIDSAVTAALTGPDSSSPAVGDLATETVSADASEEVRDKAPIGADPIGLGPAALFTPITSSAPVPCDQAITDPVDSATASLVNGAGSAAVTLTQDREEDAPDPVDLRPAHPIGNPESRPSDPIDDGVLISDQGCCPSPGPDSDNGCPHLPAVSTVNVSVGPTGPPAESGSESQLVDDGNGQHHRSDSPSSSPRCRPDTALSPVRADPQADGQRSESTLDQQESLDEMRADRVRHRVVMSYTGSPGRSSSSRDSSPNPVSDIDSDETSSRVSSQPSRSVRSPRTRTRSTAAANDLPPLPPKPRSLPARVRISPDERKRYERIARIFQGVWE